MKKTNSLTSVVLKSIFVVLAVALVACDSEKSKLKITDPNDGGGGAGGNSGLSKVDDLTKDKELDKFVDGYSKLLEKVQSDKQVAGLVTAKMKKDFAGLMSRTVITEAPRESGRATDKNGKNNRKPQRPKRVNAVEKPATLLEQIAFESNVTNEKIEVALSFKHKNFDKQIVLSESFTNDKKHYLLSTNLQDKENSFVAIYVPLTEIVQIVVIKHYKKEKIQSITPFAIFHITGNIVVENSSPEAIAKAGAFGGVDLFLNPISEVYAIRSIFESMSFSTSVSGYTGTLPKKVSLAEDEDFITAEMTFLQKGDKEAFILKMEIADKFYSLQVLVNSLFGLF